MPNEPLAELQCCSCKAPLAVEEVFDHSTVSWPQQRWIHFRCPHCRKYAHCELSSEGITLGKLDGAPGPCYFPSSAAAVDQLQIEARKGRLTVRLGERSWSFRAA